MSTVIYQRRQWLKALWISLPIITLIVFAFDFTGKSEQQFIYPLILLASINVVVLLILSSFRITLNEQYLKWEFGYLGLPRWKLNYEDISKLEVCESTWYEGWGIRLTTEGMLYNASGKKALRIYKKNGKTLRLGTPEPDVLMRNIQNKLNQQ